MSLPVDVLQELYLAEREQSKMLKEMVDRLSNEVDRLRNELSSTKPDKSEIRGDERSASGDDKATTDSAEDLLEYVDRRIETSEESNRDCQIALDATEESTRVLRSALDASDDTNRKLYDSVYLLRTALINANRPGASENDRIVQELQGSLKEMRLDLSATTASNGDLHERNKLLQDQLNHAVAGNFENLGPFLNEHVSTRYRAMRVKFLASQTELSQVKEELSKAKTDLLKSEAASTELREENQALQEYITASEIDAQQETSQSAAKAKMSPAEREMQRLKDRQSLHSLHTGW